MWQKSKNWMAKFGPTVFVTVMACSLAHGQEVRTNYVPGTDFSKYHTYTWRSIGPVGHSDQILDAEIKQSIDSQLVGKGFAKVESGSLDSAPTAGFPEPPALPRPPALAPPPELSQAPLLTSTGDSAKPNDSAHAADLFIDYQIGVQQEQQWNAFGMRDALGGGMTTGSATATSSTINNGILVVSIYDAASKQLIWRGFAVKEINLSKDQQKNRKNLDKATQKLLKDFPPDRK